MINKEKEDNTGQAETPGPVDVVDMDIQCHILINDIDTNEILVNQRG